MKIAFYSSKRYDRESFNRVNQERGNAQALELIFFEERLSAMTAPLARGCDGVCIFVNDQADAAAIGSLADMGIKVMALRCAGFNQVDLAAAETHKLTVVRVPAYSPYAVAEHTLALALTLNRNTHRAYNRVRENNFMLDGLQGFDMHGRTVGIVGTGKIGQCTARAFAGLGCHILADDLMPNHTLEEEGLLRYVDFATILEECDIISLHCPLTPETHHLIDDEAIACMKPGVMLLNTSRGKIIDTRAVIAGLKSGQIGHLGLDVYEEEEGLFFEDRSAHIPHDDIFSRLLTFPNVLITGHQAFLTADALHNIATTTLENLEQVLSGKACPNHVKVNPGAASK